jgi:methylmalonyl-CoA/ethylmalonyl-CoA epimerase
LDTASAIQALSDANPEKRAAGAGSLFESGVQRIEIFLTALRNDAAFGPLLVSKDSHSQPLPPGARVTVGIAVLRETFDRIRSANNDVPLADAPADQDVLEFELHFPGHVLLDILTTNAPGGGGAIDRFLEKFGEGIQQVEIDVKDVDRATKILRERFKLEPIYPATRPGANGTRVNFFLVNIPTGGKVLVELVEQPIR